MKGIRAGCVLGDGRGSPADNMTRLAVIRRGREREREKKRKRSTVGRLIPYLIL